jgi:hypothetical protein
MSGAKSWDLKPRTYVLWTPHKEHTESAICKDHLAPCRFKCWTNQISMGISQPPAQLQRRYNVEIPRVSLHVGRLKWDFRTDRDIYTHYHDDTIIFQVYYDTVIFTICLTILGLLFFIIVHNFIMIFFAKIQLFHSYHFFIFLTLLSFFSFFLSQWK